MKRTSILLVALALTACDNNDVTTDPEAAEALEVDNAEANPDDLREREPQGKRDHHGKRGNPADALCSELDCTDVQRAQIEAGFARPNREREHERPDHSAANDALATAFASDGFSKDDLDAYLQATRPEDDVRGSEHLDRMSELHAILSPEQRAKLADSIAQGEGPGAFSGGHHGRRGGGPMFGKRHEGRDSDGTDHRARFTQSRVEGFCEPIACTDEQRVSLAAVLTETEGDRPDLEAMKAQMKAAQTALSEAMRSASFDPDALKTTLDAAHPGKDEHHANRAEALVHVHALLTAEQRQTLANAIREDGPRALMGGKRHRGGQHDGRRGGRGKKHDGPKGEGHGVPERVAG